MKKSHVKYLDALVPMKPLHTWKWWWLEK